MIISVFDRVENIVRKGEIACTSNFSFSNNVFQKPSFPDVSKGVIEWEWVKDTKLTRDYDPIKKDSISALHPDKPLWIQKNNKSNFHHIFFFEIIKY